jgi:TRAP-type C4-dicarboxylate transport system permease small subunit
MLDAIAPLLVLLALVLLAVGSWLWGEDTVTSSLTGSDGRPVRWSL